MAVVFFRTGLEFHQVLCLRFDMMFFRQCRSTHWIKAVILLAVLAISPWASPAERPNVLLIVIDALRADSLSCYGYNRKTSPNIDRFSEDCLVFDQAISVGGNTTTAMPAIMTGRYAFFPKSVRWKPLTSFGMSRFYMGSQMKGLPLPLDTMAEVFQQNGYDEQIEPSEVPSLDSEDLDRETLEQLRGLGYLD